jgi:hypothetical protein
LKDIADLSIIRGKSEDGMRVILGIVIGAAIGFVAVYYLKSGHLPF